MLSLVCSESEGLVDVYTLQLLYVFVESLAMAQADDPSLGKSTSVNTEESRCRRTNWIIVGTQQQAIGALTHVERIIKEKSHVFMKETPKRRRPP